MSLRSPSRYSVLAGLFLLGSVALAIAIAFSLSGGLEMLSPAQTFAIRFPMSEGAPGVKKGSSVTLGGQQVGKVVRVAFDDHANNVLVWVRVSKTTPIYPGAIINLEKPLLGSQSTINIAYAGEPGSKGAKDGSGGSNKGVVDPLSESSEPINARQGAGLLAQFGITPEEVKGALTDARKAINEVRDLVEKNKDKVNQLVDDLAGMVHSAHESWPKWSDDLGVTLANARKFSDDLGPIGADAREGVKDARAFISNLNGVVDDNRADVRAIVSDFRTVTMPTLNDALVNAKSFTGTASTWAATAFPDLHRTVGNIRVASDQAKRAISEIRAQPWRVFFAPSKKELETDVMYWAANAYADAVSDLRSATDGMQNVIDLSKNAPPGTAPNPELVAAQLRLLQQSTENLKRAEQDLLDVLKQRAAGASEQVKTPAAPATGGGGKPTPK